MVATFSDPIRSASRPVSLQQGAGVGAERGQQRETVASEGDVLVDVRQHPAGEVAHDGQGEPDEERDPPAPAVQLLGGEHAGHDADGCRGHCETAVGPHGRERAVAGLLVGRRRLGDDRRGSADLAPGEEALCDADEQQQDRRQHSDRRIRRKETDRGVGEAYADHGGEQCPSTAESVADPAEEDPPDRADHIGQGEHEQY